MFSKQQLLGGLSKEHFTTWPNEEASLQFELRHLTVFGGQLNVLSGSVRGLWRHIFSGSLCIAY
jgi:hypothetical protein